MYPIYALWCHPRSISTAIERIMRERGDLDCLHEPFMYDYYMARRVRPDFPMREDDPDRPKDYEAARTRILERAEKRPVFLKDMAYYIVPRLFDDPDFADRLTHGFLIRDPRSAIASYAKLDADVTREEIGIEAQWRLYDWLKGRGISASVIRAEDVRRDPQTAIGTLWQAWQLPDAPDAFRWGEDAPKDWKHVAGWHRSVLESGGIRPPGETDPAERFAAAAAACPRLQDELAHHLPYYERLAERAL